MEVKDKVLKMGKPVISYWAGPTPITDADARQMAEGGFNLVWAGLAGKPDGISMIDFYCDQLNILQRYGLRGIISLSRYVPRDPQIQTLDDPEKKMELDTIIDSVKNHPAFYAYDIKDEPSLNLFRNLARMKNYILAKDPNHLVFINLYPNYASAKQLGVEGNIEEAYRKHLDEFVEIVKPQFLSFDHYNFHTCGQNDCYFLNLAEIRRAALKSDIPFMAILQASSWTKQVAIPTCEQMRWLAYTSLAYGSQGLMWYVYGYPGHDGGFVYQKTCDNGKEFSEKSGDAVLGGKPTPHYYFIKDELHKEFVRIAAELQPLKSAGVYHTGMLPPGTSELPDKNEFTLTPEIELKPCPDYSEESYTDCRGEYRVRYYKEPIEGFIVGSFKNDKAVTHALVVNLDYRTYSGHQQPRQQEFSKPVQREIVGPGPLEVFDAETGKWTPAGSNRVKLSLPPGGGVLVRIGENTR